MCAIIGWKGKLPKGLLSRLFSESEHRGKDSTGVAFRVNNRNVGYRQAVTAKTFVSENPKNMGDARRSFAGIGHTRRASPGMPINNTNAHPFAFYKYFFAHNGRITNWKEVKAVLVDHYTELLDRAKADKKEAEEANDEANVRKAEETLKAHTYYLNYAKGCTTDSMVLGPYIEARDFSSIMGCMALVWMKGENVYTLRKGKEAIAATVCWAYTEKVDDDNPGEDHIVTIVGSTREIIQKALEGVGKIAFNIEWNEFAPGRIFRLEPNRLVDEGAVEVQQEIEDDFSSQIVDCPVETTEVADNGATATTPQPAVTDAGETPADLMAQLRAEQKQPETTAAQGNN